MLLLTERAPEQSQNLVTAAGGGGELKAFAEKYAPWHFVRLDPSKAMLKLAEAEFGLHMSRFQLHQGYVDTEPVGPLDAANCLLVLHCLAIDDRKRKLTQFTAA